jgi:acyl-CoA reductase-like NAD-dependent aldehyde dehydrogenase
MAKQGFLLDGSWVTEGEKVGVRAPFDGAVVGETYLATAAHLEQTIAAAVRAFAVTRDLPPDERRKILLAVARGIAEQKEEFARLMALEAGKPIRTARVEVDRAIFTFTLAAEEALELHNKDEVLRLRTDLDPGSPVRTGMVRRFPIGPIAAITPFNFPLNLVAHKLAPAMAVGCPVVLKPAPQTPLTALKLAALINDAGWPAGGLNVLPMANEVAAKLVGDDRLKMLSFTGSSTVGWQLKTQAGKKRVVLELGGNAGCVVCEDGDVAEAATRCAVGGFSYAGQSCISVQRIFVQQKVFAQFVDELVPKVRALVCGDPLDESTDVGPLIRDSDAVRVEEWINEAVRGGAKLLCGGKRIMKGRGIEPAVLTRTSPQQRVNCEEIFGPVVTVEPYESFDEVLQRVNDSRYGLQAGIFTKSEKYIARAFEELEVGGVIVNDVPTYRSDQMPYGGVKDSGLGREGVKYAMEEMLEMKVLVSRR